MIPHPLLWEEEKFWNPFKSHHWFLSVFRIVVELLMAAMANKIYNINVNGGGVVTIKKENFFHFLLID